MPDDSRFDGDPEALAWARAKVQAEIDRCRAFAAQTPHVQRSRAEVWRRIADRMQRSLVGGEGCAVAAFDERLPALVRGLTDRHGSCD